ncbi:hypothetical protein ABIE65_003825 [Constrictibacter sp. MBR-5]|jgi:hypothetical protein
MVRPPPLRIRGGAAPPPGSTRDGARGAPCGLGGRRDGAGRYRYLPFPSQTFPFVGRHPRQPRSPLPRPPDQVRGKLRRSGEPAPGAEPPRPEPSAGGRCRRAAGCRTFPFIPFPGWPPAAAAVRPWRSSRFVPFSGAGRAPGRRTAIPEHSFLWVGGWVGRLAPARAMAAVRNGGGAQRAPSAVSVRAGHIHRSDSAPRRGLDKIELFFLFHNS